MTIYDMVNELTEMLFGEKGTDFENLRKNIAKQLTQDKITIPPQYMVMKITNVCNSNCIYCGHAREKVKFERKNRISTERVHEIIDEAIALGVKAIGISGGEPLVRDDVEGFIKQIADRDVIPVLLTNGYYLKDRAKALYDSGLRYFIVSIDSLDEDTFFAQRGVSLKPVLEGIDELVKLKEKDDSVKIHITPVITAKNITQMPGMVEHFSAKKVALQFSPFHTFGLDGVSELGEFDKNEVVETVDKLLQMKKDGYLVADSFAFIEHFKKFMCEGKIVPDGYNCLVAYASVFVDAFETVRACWCGGYNVDNLKNKSLGDIWYSEKYADIRKKMYNCVCPGCWLLCTGELSMMLYGQE
ncbi:MAG: radical SAM protein [Clostridiales bacterium]|nr:radical SAM protein [Clostridiales bacterium]